MTRQCVKCGQRDDGGSLGFCLNMTPYHDMETVGLRAQTWVDRLHRSLQVAGDHDVTPWGDRANYTDHSDDEVG